ncbi:hypothetical protein [Novosphingobium sp.]|uniref:hypothetical protein n=1 Tax=Novosphingobium sp. TaxID=1874826 RepID=UPI002634710D|nr:hypothetical protein [Novosphingobium sp.]
MDAAQGEPQGLRGLLPIGGRSILRHQLGLAMALGCSRIVVLAETLTNDLVALQHAAEAGGARFHVIASARALAPLVAAEDELLVLGEGLLAMPEDALRLLGDGPVVLTLPVETGLPLGFERIDINNAGAGAMLLPGKLIAALGDLPGDWNPGSALLRIASQARIIQRELPALLLDQGRWRLIRDEAEAHRAEPGWVRLHTAGAEVRSPGSWIAAGIVRMLGPALLHAGTRPYVIALGAVVMALLGTGAGWFGWTGAGFAMLAVAWLVHQVASLLARVERDSLISWSDGAPLDHLADWVLDGMFITLCAWRSEIPAVTGVPWGIAWFPPVVLFMLLRLLQRLRPGEAWIWWLGDRFVIGALLTVSSILFPFDFVLRALVIALLVAGFLLAAKADEPVRTSPGDGGRAA